MPPIRQLGRGSVGGTYLQALRPRGLEQSFSVRDKLEVKYFRDYYERSSVQLRWTQFQGGDGWAGVGAGPAGQPYAPWQPYRGA
ncbi:MAG: hypothetical protein EP343_05810 [Deltaproteobacteria bacterium]|jgi:hypothetical protein|nr:MAG: hypothetical protein EP343_05810 [Deltaproteobacteria bacterium]